MDLLISAILLIGSLYILVKASDWLVDGAGNIAQKLRIAPIVIGLTIVSFGTSAPELVVSITSALQGSTNIAIGNIVGSNLFNSLFILGVSACIYPIVVKSNTVWKEIPMSLVAALLIVLLGMGEIINSRNINLLQILENKEQVGVIGLSSGLVLLIFYGIFMYYTFGISKDQETEIEPDQETGLAQNNWWNIGLVLAGMGGLILGGRLSVTAALDIATTLQIDDRIIGLTVIAFGTSLPELFTSVTASLKKQSDIVIGNVIGSNIFNIFLVLGSTSLIKDVPLNGSNIFDILVLLAGTIAILGFLILYKKHEFSRPEGVLMVLAYLTYLGFIAYF